jgi:ABC-type multidrug transport system ATPase subunit
MLSLVDRLLVLDNGQLVADGPKEAVLEALRRGQAGAFASGHPAGFSTSHSTGPSTDRPSAGFR